ncbi:competence type IV pilus major pilin ComGC [Alkalicoccus urumqiensis]|uniref:ComG operon protein 3 n=1 Tax=Alkalicoccus urumqiensis TaxID=1548213 RepID=A0A2P6MK94_ALKUR|nr:competence type IV pilus major pilin ComGC [Alkalicoccus urumqiensis]PRO66688.1 competence protein ComG [Alkalicoccus urumqiensis]
MSRISNEKGFTLIEVMVVLVIISMLLLVFIPNLAKNQSVAGEKSCEAVLELTESQVLAYYSDNGDYPASIEELETEGYVDRTECPDGSGIVISGLDVSVDAP